MPDLGLDNTHVILSSSFSLFLSFPLSHSFTLQHLSLLDSGEKFQKDGIFSKSSHNVETFHHERKFYFKARKQYRKIFRCNPETFDTFDTFENRKMFSHRKDLMTLPLKRVSYHWLHIQVHSQTP